MRFLTAGGPGFGDVEDCLLTEEFAYGCTGITTALCANCLGVSTADIFSCNCEQTNELCE